MIRAASGLAVQEPDQPCLRTCKPLPLFARKRSKDIDQNSLSRNMRHVAGVDPAAGTPGESDAPLEHGGLWRMESVLVRADGRSAAAQSRRSPSETVSQVPTLHQCCRPAGALQVVMPSILCHSESPSTAVPAKAGRSRRKPGPLQAGAIGAPAPNCGQIGPEKRRQFRPRQIESLVDGAPGGALCLPEPRQLAGDAWPGGGERRGQPLQCVRGVPLFGHHVRPIVSVTDDDGLGDAGPVLSSISRWSREQARYRAVSCESWKSYDHLDSPTRRATRRRARRGDDGEQYGDRAGEQCAGPCRQDLICLLLTVRLRTRQEEEPRPLCAADARPAPYSGGK